MNPSCQWRVLRHVQTDPDAVVGRPSRHASGVAESNVSRQPMASQHVAVAQESALPAEADERPREAACANRIFEEDSVSSTLGSP